VIAFLKANNASLQEIVALSKTIYKVATLPLTGDVRAQAAKMIRDLDNRCDCPDCTSTSTRSNEKDAAEAKVN
jgi:hypothetical protein